MGTESIQTVTCAQGRYSTCSIRVPAPGFALVFLSSDALAQSEPQGTMTFSTTTMTRTANTAYISPSELATAQGQNGQDRQHRGSTSKGSAGSGAARTIAAGAPVTLRTLLCATTILNVFGLWLARTL